MSNHVDATKNEYVELDKKIGAAEYELAANIAETDKALDTALKKGKKGAKTARTQIERKVGAPSRKDHSDGS